MNIQANVCTTEPEYMSRDLCAGTNASHKLKYPPIMNHRNRSNNYSNCVIELFDDQLLDSVHIRDPSKDQTISKWSVKTATTVPLDEDDYDFDDDDDLASLHEYSYPEEPIMGTTKSSMPLMEDEIELLCMSTETIQISVSDLLVHCDMSLENIDNDIIEQAESNIHPIHVVPPITDDDIRPEDILMGQSPKFRKHSGNLFFRQEVVARYEEYLACSKLEKTKLSREILDKIATRGGRFLKRIDDGTSLWEEVPEAEAREKVSSSFRDEKKKRKNNNCKK